jgi:hypothetical protein
VSKQAPLAKRWSRVKPVWAAVRPTRLRAAAVLRGLTPEASRFHRSSESSSRPARCCSVADEARNANVIAGENSERI